MKYVLVTGGSLSGIGKGVVTSSAGLLLQAMGLRVTAIKIDPYLNIDAGTMSPFEHGEVFVLNDGGEVDLDLGNYERFLNFSLQRDHNITTGKIYQSVINKERRGDYLGKTVQVVPHITNEIQDWVEQVAGLPIDDSGEKPDVCVIELGGTIGDIESMPFIEAMRQFQFRVGKGNFCSIHVSLVPCVGTNNEQKTKPTQQSVRESRALGISPDIIAARSSKPLEQSVKEKISLFCHVAPENVLTVYDVSNIYRVPIILKDQSLPSMLVELLKLETKIKPIDLKAWINFAEVYDQLNKNSKEVHIVLVGKYTGLSDAYHSVIKSLQHSACNIQEKLVIDWIEASDLEEQTKTDLPEKYEIAWKTLKNGNGILVPGGFGDRGIEGKILAANYARINKIPYLGICLGFQLATIEVCRNVLNMKDATSTEFDPNTKFPVVIYMPEISKTHLGGTMRLGKRVSIFQDNYMNESILYELYGRNKEIIERHRHRYEINPELVDRIEKETDCKFVARDDSGKRMEIMEIKNHPYFVGVQYHPEFKSRPIRPSPPFIGLMLASSGRLNEVSNFRF